MQAREESQPVRSLARGLLYSQASEVKNLGSYRDGRRGKKKHRRKRSDRARVGGIMKKQLLIVFAGLLLAVGSAYAQSSRLVADIPFDFIVGNKVFPAGQYEIKGV